MSVADGLWRALGVLPEEVRVPLPRGAKEPAGQSGRPLWTVPAILEEVPFSAFVPVPHKCPACRSRYAFRTTRARYCEHEGDGFRVPMRIVRSVVRGGAAPPIGAFLPPGWDGYLIRLGVEAAA
jgi:hypothetical protein